MKNVQMGLILGQSVIIAALGVAAGLLFTQKPGSAAAAQPGVSMAPAAAPVAVPARAPEDSGASAAEVRTLTRKLDEFFREIEHAREDNRQNAVASTLQTLRSQIELYKIQHADNPPPTGALWTQMTHATNTTGITILGGTTRTFSFGPYVQAPPVNPANGQSAVGAKPSPKVGWVYRVNGTQYTIEAVNTAGDGVLEY